MIVDDGQVELAVVEPGQQALQVIIDHGERHVGVLPLEPGERRGDERGQRGRKAAEAEPAVPPAGYLAEFLLSIADSRQQRPRVPHQGESGVGQLDRARSAFDQGQVHGPFQGRDVLAHRQLGHLQRLGGCGEGTAGGDALQHLEPPDMSYQLH